MSDIDMNTQTDGDPELVEAPVLTSFERFLLGINLWSSYAIIAITIVKDNSYLSSASFGSLVFGWVLLGVISIISLDLWRVLKRGRTRAGVAVMCFMVFNLLFWFGTFDKPVDSKFTDVEFSVSRLNSGQEGCFYK